MTFRPQPFEPLFRNSHLETIAAHFWPRPDSDAAFPPERRYVRTEPDVEVLVETQRPATPAGHVVLLHGLEGSGKAGYMRSMSASALAAGYAVHRFHMRSCGGTESHCNTLYHAGLTGDLLAFLRQLDAPAYLVGFSLGGNVALKLAGELGESAAPLIHGVCAVSTALDLAACARRIHQPDNFLYERRFVRHMLARLRATGRYTERDLAGLHSVIGIDDRITAPSFGFGNAENYYRTQSALGFLDAISVPVLLIQAKDDTFVPFAAFKSEAVRRNPHIELLATEHGGHVGFIARRPPRLWLDETVIQWILTKPAAKKQAWAPSRC
jgi:predicted alpha/beta-fold hydrolase